MPFDVSWNTLWKIFLMVVLGWVIYFGLDVLLGLFLAVIIAAALDGPVSWMQKKGLPRILGTLIIFIIAITIMAAVVYAIVPVVISEFTNLFLNFSDYSKPILDFVKASDVFEGLGAKLNVLSDTLISGSTPLLHVAGTLFGGVFLTITILILSFYLTVGQDGVEKLIIAVVPHTYEDYALDLYFRVRRKIGRWLKAQVVLSLVMGVSVFVGLWLLDIEYSLMLGLLAGIFEIIPFVGPVFSGGLAVLLALPQSLTLAVYTFALFVIIQQIENHVLVPSVMRFATALNPAVVMISILLGGSVFGFAGIILAVPTAVLAQEIIEDWTVSKQKRRGLGL